MDFIRVIPMLTTAVYAFTFIITVRCPQYNGVLMNKLSEPIELTKVLLVAFHAPFGKI